MKQTIEFKYNSKTKFIEAVYPKSWGSSIESRSVHISMRPAYLVRFLNSCVKDQNKYRAV